MVKLNVVRSLNTTLVQSQPLVAVFFAGTGGIGSYTLRALTTAEGREGGKGLRLYIIGRNVKAAEEILADCRRVYPKGQFTFIKTDDLSSMKEVDRVCTELTELELQEEQPRIDYLMLSQGCEIFKPRKDTKEGLDVAMSLLYYSRMKAILNLLPLLLKSNLPATVVSVYASGIEANIYPEDLSLRDLKLYTYSQARSHMIYMHTLFMECLAEQNPGKLTLVHIFPGLVKGPGFDNPENAPAWLRLTAKWIIFPFFEGIIAVKPEDCGMRMVSLASPHYPPRPVNKSVVQKGVALGTDRKPGSGVYALNWDGEDNLKAKKYEKFDKDEMRKKVWDHTTKAFEVIGEGKVFTE